MKRSVFILIMWTLTIGLAQADEPSTDKIGSKIELQLKDSTGQIVPMPAKKARVFVFLSFDCPVSNSYMEGLKDLTTSFAAQDVAFFGICSPDVPQSDLAKFVKEFGLTFPVFRDDQFAIADALKAETTPEAFVLDRNNILRYRGRIDNGYVARLRKTARVTETDLKNALDDIVASRPVRVPATTAIGCKFSRTKPPVKANATTTYYRDVAPILQTHCQSCHRPGAVGPFSLMSYEQAVNWGNDIQEYTRNRKMPPWKPSQGVAFSHDRRLSDSVISTLARWVDEGMPEGNPKDAPPPAGFTDGWTLGKPDLILTPNDDFIVGPSGSDLFRVFVLPTGLTEDRYVTAFEVKPGNPRVVHHTLNFVDPNNAARAIENREAGKTSASGFDRGPGYSVRMGIGIIPRGNLGGWAPGQVPRELPADTGFFLPKGSDVVMQVHYHRTGKVEKDRTSIGIYFAKKPVSKVMEGLAVGITNPIEMFGMVIPANERQFTVKRRLWTAEECTLHSVMPHMHLIGKSIKISMTTPNGLTTTLVAIDDWDYGWQETYHLKEPIRVPEGTRFDLEVVYDNSTSNVNNPNDPPKPVRFGEQTTNEMAFGFLGVTGDKRGPVHFYIDEGKRLLLPPRRAASK